MATKQQVGVLDVNVKAIRMVYLKLLSEILSLSHLGSQLKPCGSCRSCSSFSGDPTIKALQLILFSFSSYHYFSLKSDSTFHISCRKLVTPRYFLVLVDTL